MDEESLRYIPRPTRGGTYRTVTVYFDDKGNEIAPVGVAPAYDAGLTFPAFAIVKPVITNTRADVTLQPITYRSSDGAFHISLQMFGDLTGFGVSCFDQNSSGYEKTAKARARALGKAKGVGKEVVSI